MHTSLRFIVLLALAAPTLAMVLMTASTVGSPTNTSSPQHTNPAQTQTPDRGASSPKTENRSRPEITIADYLLQPRARIDKLLGPPQASYDCVDTTGKQFDYKDGSHVCVRNGKVVLFSYNLRGPVKSAQEVLKAVGIDDSTKPYDVGFGFMWVFERGNPLRVGNGFAGSVMVLLGRAPNIPPIINVEMDGSHPISKPAPRPQAAAVAEYLGLYQSDFPGVFEDAKLESGVLVLHVSSQWNTLGAGIRRKIVESLGDRWQAVNHGYGNSVRVSGITIRHQDTGAVIGKWPK